MSTRAILRDPHDPRWRTIEDPESEIELQHTPIPTFVSTTTVMVRYGAHLVPKTRTVYTNRRPSQNTQPEEASQ